MKISNKFNLPEPIINAIKGFEKGYQNSRADTNVSVTQLLQPAHLRRLSIENAENIEEDAADRIWALVGQAVHGILEQQASGELLTEERLFTEIDGLRISGQADLYDPTSKILSDYKITSVWSVIGSHKKEWEQQLNLLAYLCIVNNIEVKQLQIVAILRDWSKFRAMDKTYPQCQVKVIDIPLWTKEEQVTFLNERLEAHKGDILPCTKEERWAKPTKYALKKDGRKSAVKLYDNAEECLDAIRQKGTNYGMEVRKGENIRCNHYCSVSKFCKEKEEK